jgi:hypothetical protein
VRDQTEKIKLGSYKMYQNKGAYQNRIRKLVTFPMQILKKYIIHEDEAKQQQMLKKGPKLNKKMSYMI